MEGFAPHLVLKSSATASFGYKKKSTFFSMVVRRQLFFSRVSSSARQKSQQVLLGRSAELAKAPFFPLLLHLMLLKSRSDI